MNIALILSKTTLVAKLKLVAVYPKQIAEVIKEPKYCGGIQNANALGSDAKFDCGCFFHIEMHITSDSLSLIEEVSYATNGCGFMIAAAERLSSQLRGIKLTDLNARLDGVTQMNERSGCESTVFTAVKIAFADHRSRKIEEFRGEKALICTCFGIEEETVEQFVRSEGPKDIAEVMQRLRAGSGCGSCRMLIQEIIDASG